MEDGLMRSTRAPRSCITVHYRSPDMIKNCYTVMIFGRNILTTVTRHPDVAADWIATVRKDHPVFRIIGFEIEFDFKTSHIGTLQLCTSMSCLIFQLDKRSPLPACLDRFLGDQTNDFVGTHVQSKLNLLRKQFPFVAKVAFNDLTGYGEFLKERRRSDFGSMKLGKVETSWDRLPYKLSHQQVHYACLHAFHNRNMMFSKISYINL